MLEGNRAFEKMGAHLREGGSADFSVWAPRAGTVGVIGDFNGWVPTPLERGKGGVFRGRVRGVKNGDRYKFRITGREGGAEFDKADPFGRANEPLPGTASVVTVADHDWRDRAWMRSRKGQRPISIYEVHLGSFCRAGDRFMTYAEMARPLADHVKRMGFTHVELMPVMEHPFYGSWGYGVTGFFSPTHRHGSPTDLMRLVDTLHEEGIGVVLDWVPAHFANDAHGLSSFDGAPLFERGVHPTWNTGLFDYSRPEVRSFLLSSAVYWIETFHADGLRVDGVESMLYLDHGTPGRPATQKNEDGIAFLRDLTRTLKEEHPDVFLAAEDSSAWPGVTKQPDVGGLGFDFKWDMGFSHDMRSYLAVDPLFRSQRQGALTFRSIYADSESFIIPLSHDDVAERPLVEQMHGDPWQKLANLRLLVSMQYAQTGKKLLFMGNEYGEPRAWHHDRALDLSLLDRDPHAGVARMVRDLNRLYREERALEGSFEWIDGTNAEMSVIVFGRRAGSEYIAVALNATPVPRPQYRIGLPKGGHWRELFNSDARDYGGTGHGNLGGVEAVPYPWNERRFSAVVTLPPLGALFLKG